MNYTIKTLLLLIVGLSGLLGQAQVTSQEDTSANKTTTRTAELEITDEIPYSEGDLASAPVAKDTVSLEPFKIDGVAAVIGDLIVLDSDIRKMYEDLKSQGIPTEGTTDCDLIERLMKNKLYAHQAVQDSITVDEGRIASMTEQRIGYFIQELGSMEKLLEFYNMDSENELRSKLTEIAKEQELSNMMQNKIIEEVEITPEEVRSYFNDIPEGERPKFGDEVEIAQIVIEPEVPQAETQKVIDRLNDFRDEILSGESTFATKAVLYSEDPGTSSSGGQITLTRKARFVQEFKDVAFSLQEGEISKPFKTDFGYHILQVDKIRGQEIDVRHILLIPSVTPKTVQEAKVKADSIQKLILTGKMDFDTAARKFSDQKETRGDGGKLINPMTGDTRFEQTKVDPSIYNQVVNLKEGQVSGVMTDNDQLGKIFYKFITVTDRYPAHTANYAQDFAKIKDLALTEKKMNVIAAWQKEKIADTYIKINGKFRDCDFLANWLKR